MDNKESRITTVAANHPQDGTPAKFEEDERCGFYFLPFVTAFIGMEVGSVIFAAIEHIPDDRGAGDYYWGILAGLIGAGVGVLVGLVILFTFEFKRRQGGRSSACLPYDNGNTQLDKANQRDTGRTIIYRSSRRNSLPRLHPLGTQHQRT